MDYWNYLPWIAKYSDKVIKEDQTIPRHFLQLTDLDKLQEISYVDGLTRYTLDCRIGKFKVNEKYLNLSHANGTVPEVGRVASKIISPQDQFTGCGIFQFKQAIGKGELNLTLGIESYNIGYRVSNGIASLYQRMILNGQTGEIVIQVIAENSMLKQKEELFFPVKM